MAFKILNIKLICADCGSELVMCEPKKSTELCVAFEVAVVPCKKCGAKHDKLITAMKDALA